MSQKQNKESSIPVKCSCGKMVARMRNGKIYVYCKTCKREVQLKLEPRATVAQSH